jgi:deoxyribose-phosphate aldolase
MTATAHDHESLPRNTGTALNLSWFTRSPVNAAAVAARVAALARRRIAPAQEPLWLTRAIECIDLTTLAGDDTRGRVERLCAKARDPLRPDLVAALGRQDHPPHVAAVCVYPAMVPHAVRALSGSGIPVASVATGFPAGLTPLAARLAEIRHAVAEGAAEIDIVIFREHVLTQNWQALHDELAEMRAACGAAHMKAILATGDLKTLRNVHRAAMVAMMAGADVIKTSTGKEEVNATLPVSLTMLRAIRDYQALSGQTVGFKPAGGLRTAADALAWLTLMKEELGKAWTEPDLFRIGASSLLGSIEQRLDHLLTGARPSPHRHVLA